MVRLLATLLRSSRATVPVARPLCFRRGYSAASGGSDDACLSSKPVAVPKEDSAPSEESSESQISKAPFTPTIGPQGMKLPTSSNRYIPAMHLLLRDGCKCPLCVNQHSKQRNFRMSDIPKNVKPRSVDWDGETLKVKWENDIPGFDESHTSVYSHEELKKPSANYPYSPSGRRRKRQLWGSEHKHRWVTYEEYMNDESTFSDAMRSLARTGLLFVKGIPDSREEVEKIATRMGPLRNTFYGATWDVRTVPEAKNVAYTNQYLGFHMDLMYMNEPPGFQLLHCLQNSCDGGESLFADSFAVANQLRIDDREAFVTLCNLRLSYEYNHADHVYTNDWPVFQTYRDDKTKATKLTHANYSPPFQAPMFGKRRSFSPTVNDFEALNKFANMLEDKKYIFELKLNPGECVIFENRRVLHARRQFNTATGQRWLAGAYVDEDALLSQFAVMSRKYPEIWFNSKRQSKAESQKEEGQIKEDES
ncbi:hypothetical protein ETB97_004793 [Aspergillus alliaceus]|uniref:Gamma-butyrobetaine hydroxylase subfamily n=1 Tax=Petromyces alliaceus TaxID=209559 RepID=A0A8H6AFT6_PETAA|nr:hypothetical protein ETB97_004793 [Aspergillus burnettii]